MPVFSRGRGRGQSEAGPFFSYRGRGSRGGFRGGPRGAPPFRGRGRGGSRGAPRSAHASSSRSNQTSIRSRRRDDSEYDAWAREWEREGDRADRDNERSREWEEIKGEDESEDRVGGKREEKEWKLKPEDVVDEFKRQGHFDALRKVLLSQFSQSDLKQQLLKSVHGRLLYSLEKDLVYRVEDEVLAMEANGINPGGGSGSSPVKGKGKSRYKSHKERDGGASDRGIEMPREVPRREWGKKQETESQSNPNPNPNSHSDSNSNSKSNYHHSYTSSVEGVNYLTQEEIDNMVKQASSSVKEIDARLRHAENLKVLERSQIFEDLLSRMKYNDDLGRHSSSSSKPKAEDESDKDPTDKQSGDKAASKQTQSQAFLSKESKIGKQIQESLFGVIKAERRRLRREERLEKGGEAVDEDEEDDEEDSDNEDDSEEEKDNDEAGGIAEAEKDGEDETMSEVNTIQNQEQVLDQRTEPVAQESTADSDVEMEVDE